MKIIINQPRASYFVGGAEMISFEHAINFYKLGNDVYFYTISPASIGLDYSEQFKIFYKKNSDKIKVIEIDQDSKIKHIYNIQPGENRCRWNIESIFYNQKLYEYISKENISYDIIFSYYNLDAVFIPKNLIYKNILYLCGIPKEQNDFQGSFLSVYDVVLAISNDVKKSWEKYYDKINVIETGVDFNRFSLKRFKTNDIKEITLLYAGRLIIRKNIDKIIYAFERLSNNYNLKLLIIGDGPDKNRLKNLTNASNIVFKDIVLDIENYYKLADIFITPSEYGEGIQGAVLEAMSCGLTVIATNTKINKQLLDEGRGFVVEPNVESIIEGIKKAIATDRIEISKKTRKYIMEYYDWKDKIAQILEVLK